jgi:hypothetical protein
MSIAGVGQGALGGAGTGMALSGGNPWGALAGAVLGAGLSMKAEADRAKAQGLQNQIESEKTRYSPWTGMKGQTQVNFNNQFGSAAAGGLAGLDAYGKAKQAGLFAQQPKGIGNFDDAPKMDTQSANDLSMFGSNA